MRKRYTTWMLAAVAASACCAWGGTIATTSYSAADEGPHPKALKIVKSGEAFAVTVELAGLASDATVHAARLRAERGELEDIRDLLADIEIYVGDTDALLGRKRKKRVSSKKTFRTDSGEYTILLASDLLDVDVEVIADLYRLRWQIELFFRWFKKVLQADHPLSLCRNGMTIVAYCALIASLLVTLWTGRKPTKRTFEMV